MRSKRASRPSLFVLCALLALSAAAPGEESVEVIIARDAHGVPHIRSATDAGAFFGLGYATAEDRLVQMNLNVRTVQGRMAELLGPAWVEQDRYFRIVGMWRQARTVAAGLDAEHRALLQAYADGVNAWLGSHPEGLHELFAELEMEPEVWTPAHSIAAWWRVGNLFISDPFTKASPYYAFMDLVRELGLDEAIAEFLGEAHPGDPEAGVVQASDVPEEVRDAIAAYAAAMGYGDAARGIPPRAFAARHPHHFAHPIPRFSHAWAVGGARTTTGKAVILSDPQYPVSFPNLLYEWQFTGATFNARGARVPGAAGFLIGFNEHLAWGLTAAGADQRDLMRLEMMDRNRYLVDGVAHPLETEEEIIHVRGGSDVVVSWQSSLWGPVVTALVDEVRGDDGFALKGTPYDEDGHDTFEGMLAMMRAGDLDALRAALELWRFPSANLVAGDDRGNVFFTVLGSIPVRSALSPLGGLIAQDGSSLAYDWQDLIPGAYKPWVLNPAAGYVASANHRAAGDWYPLPLGLGTGCKGDTTRSRRLKELIEALPTPATPAVVLEGTQYDCANSGKRDMVAILRHARDAGMTVSAAAQSTLDHLDAWSAGGGQNLTVSPGVFLATKIDVTFRVAQAGEGLIERYGGGDSGLNLFLKTQMAAIAADPAYRPDADTMAYLDRTLAAAWLAAVAVSPDPTAWDPGYAAGPQVHPVLGWFASPTALGPDFDGRHRHTPPTLRCVDGNTIWSQRSELYTQFADLDAVDTSATLLPPGNSEGPEDGSWQSQAVAWAAGELKPAPLGAAAVAAITVQEVTLTYPPAGVCLPDDTTLCFHHGRFRVEVEWTDFQGNTGPAKVVPYGSDNSGILWFFDSANWEMLVKVLAGCGVNDHYWVFAAATTNVAYRLRVTDTASGQVREYLNPLGQSSPAITDVQAFAACG